MNDQNSNTNGHAVTVKAGLVGAFAGVFVWLLSGFINRLAIGADCMYGACGGNINLAYFLAELIVGGATVWVLVKNNVYRPLLVVLSAIIALYGVQWWLGGRGLLQAVLWGALVWGLATMAFAHISKSSSFAFALVSAVFCTLVIRVALM